MFAISIERFKYFNLYIYAKEIDMKKLVAVWVDEKMLKQFEQLRQAGYNQSRLIRKWCGEGISELTKRQKMSG